VPSLGAQASKDMLDSHCAYVGLVFLTGVLQSRCLGKVSQPFERPERNPIFFVALNEF
jgi:hypothetical protein